MYRFKKSPQDLPELFVDALNLFGHGLKVVWIWALLAATFGLVTPHMVIEGFSMTSDKIQVHINWPMMLVVSSASLPAAFCVGMMTRRLFVLGADQDESVGQSISVVFRKFIPMYIGLFVVALISIIGWMLIFIPGIFFAVVFTFTMPLILLDDYSILGALKESWHLVYDNWWRIFVMMVIPILMVVAVAMMPAEKMPYIVMILQGFVMWFTVPMLLSFLLTIFYDSKLRHHVPLHLPKDESNDAGAAVDDDTQEPTKTTNS